MLRSVGAREMDEFDDIDTRNVVYVVVVVGSEISSFSDFVYFWRVILGTIFVYVFVIF